MMVALLRVIVTCFIRCQRSCLAALGLRCNGSESAGLYKHYKPSVSINLPLGTFQPQPTRAVMGKAASEQEKLRQAKARLRRIQHYEQVTYNVGQTCCSFGVSRRQFCPGGLGLPFFRHRVGIYHQRVKLFPRALKRLLGLKRDGENARPRLSLVTGVQRHDNLPTPVGKRAQVIRTHLR